jgi:hypothetical protein
MKIYILPVKSDFQPAKQPFLYPKYNQDYGVEQDFLAYLKLNSDLLVDNAYQADLHYLPVFWTRYHLNRNRRTDGLSELQIEVNRLILNDKKTFTVCQFDDGPIVDIGNTLQCLSSRKNASIVGIDIPLLASPISKISRCYSSRKYLASFIGQFKNHPIRFELNDLLKNRMDVYYQDGDFGIEMFVRKTLESRIGICPRGYGGSSFRLYEVMQLCRVPIVVGDVDPRPFKKFLPWEKISFYIRDAEEIISILDYALTNDLEKMGMEAMQVWKSLNYMNWCHYLLLELSRHKE